MVHPKLKFVEGGTYIVIIYPTFYVRLGAGKRFYRWLQRSLVKKETSTSLQTDCYSVKLEKNTAKDKIALYFNNPRVWIFIDSAMSFIENFKDISQLETVTKPVKTSPGVLKILNESYNDVLLGGNQYVVSWPIIIANLPPVSFQEKVTNIDQSVDGFEYLAGSGGILIRYGSSHTLDRQFIFSASVLPKQIKAVVGECIKAVNKELKDELTYIGDGDDLAKKLSRMNDILIARFRAKT